MKKLLETIFPLLGPAVIASMPGTVLLFYYQIHIGNLPNFINQPNLLWIALSIGTTGFLMYGFMLLLGAASVFWFYAVLILFYRCWIKMTGPENVCGPSPKRTRDLQAKSPILGILGIVACFATVLGVTIAWFHGAQLPDLEHIAQTIRSAALETTVFFSQFHIQNALRSQVFAFGFGNVSTCIFGTYLWYQYRKSPLLHPDTGACQWTVQNSLPTTRAEWKLYSCLSLACVVGLAIFGCVVVSEDPNCFFIFIVLCGVLSFFLPALVWRACRNIPRNNNPSQHSFFPDSNVLSLLYFIFSLLLFCIFISIIQINFQDKGFISLILYFFTTGFLMMIVMDKTPWSKMKQGGIVLCALPFMLILFHGAWSTLARQCISFAGFHTWRQNSLFVTSDTADRVVRLLGAYDIAPAQCSELIDGQEMHRISIDVQNKKLFLNMVWSDGADKRLIGFDGDEVPSIAFVPDFSVPTLSVNSQDVRELPTAWIEPCT